MITVTMDDMVHTISEESNTSLELNTVFLYSYLGVVRWTVLCGFEETKNLHPFSREEFVWHHFSEQMIPDPWKQADFIERIAQEIELYPHDTFSLLTTLAMTIRTFLKTHKTLDFVPLGHVQHGKSTPFKVRLSKTFFYPSPRQIHSGVGERPDHATQTTSSAR